MNMKHFIIPIISAALLSGCSQGAKSSVPSEPETTAAAATSTEPTTTKPIVTIASPTRRKDETVRFTVGVQGSSVTVLRGGSAVGVIEADVQLAGPEDVVIGDFNFDGYDDLFIYDDVYTGAYWLCVPDTMEFTRSEAMALADGKALLMDADSSSRTLTMKQNVGYGSCETVYRWQDDVLVPVSCICEYTKGYGDDAERLADVLEFDEKGRRIITERRHINYNTGACFRTETDVPYLCTTDSSVDYMKGRELIQSIDVTGLPQLYDRIKQNGKVRFLPYSSANRSDSADVLLLEEDYDFDGHNDLRIQTDLVLAGGDDKYVYYRYDEAADRYTEWQELNELGAVAADPYKKELSYYDKLTLDEDHNCYIFIWDDGKLRMTKRTFYHGDSNQCDTYEYDEDGNEHFVRSGIYIKDNFDKE